MSEEKNTIETLKHELKECEIEVKNQQIKYKNLIESDLDDILCDLNKDEFKTYYNKANTDILPEKIEINPSKINKIPEVDKISDIKEENHKNTWKHLKENFKKMIFGF